MCAAGSEKSGARYTRSKDVVARWKFGQVAVVALGVAAFVFEVLACSVDIALVKQVFPFVCTGSISFFRRTSILEAA